MTAHSGNIDKRNIAQEQYNYLFNKAAIPAALTKLPENIFVEVNEAFEKIFGYSNKEVTGKTSLELGMVQPEERELTIKDIQKHGYAVDLEKHVYTKSGNLRFVLINVNAFEWNDEKFVITTLQDITERKCFEEALNNMMERLNLATGAAKIGIYDWNIKSNKLVWDERMYKLYGINKIDFREAYEAWLNGIHPDDRAYSDDISQQALRGEIDYHTEFRVLWPDGSVHWLKAHGQIFRDINDLPVRMVGINYDITKEKEAQEKVVQLKRIYATLSQINQTIVRVKERSELYQSICNVSARFGEFNLVWIGLLDEKTGLINPVACNGNNLNGIPFQSIRISDPEFKNDISCRAIHENRTITIDDIQNDQGMQHWQKNSMQIGFKSQAAVPFRLREKIIGVLNLHSPEKAFFNAIEEILLLDEIGLDISFALDALEIDRERIQNLTDLKHTQEKLLASEGTLKLFVEYAPAAIAMFDREMKYLAVSERFIKDYHVTNKNIIGHSHYEIFPEISEAWKTIHRNCLAGTSDKADKDPFLRMDGNLDWIRWEIHPWFEKSGEIGGIILFSEVITERIHDEEEIKKLNEELELRVIERTKQLEAANKELEAFSFSVSHDLRAPLRAMSGFTQILKQSYSSSLDDEGIRILEIITGNAKKMNNLIDDLLAFSKLGKQETFFSLVNMRDIADSVYQDLAPEKEKEKITFILHDIPPAFGDASMIKQVWVNLIGNALKFSSLTDHRIIEIDGHENGAEKSYSVKDNGAGFNMKYVNKLFSVFQRLHSANQFEGTGVGLAIVHRIILRLNGRVWAEGIENKGATFYFTLPNKLNA